MFMQRIEAQAETAAPSRPKALKLAAGIAFLLVSALVMVPWLCIVAAWFVIGGAARGAARLGRTIYDTVSYAGELVIGR
ncbi:MAG: hypothetical protein QOH81_3223 [Sphingomonadales bacterium]|jgi:hypothetical protein|nr:hypothetical protein [Sphingomonadales bacterium]